VVDGDVIVLVKVLVTGTLEVVVVVNDEVEVVE
jgi:hypothetical protein